MRRPGHNESSVLQRSLLPMIFDIEWPLPFIEFLSIRLILISRFVKVVGLATFRSCQLQVEV